MNALRSLSVFASQTEPLEDLDQVVARLRVTTAESRVLEWKATGLFGPHVTIRTKYRAVKAVISFANTEGGFVLFGVDPTGKWIGLSDSERLELDPAKVTDLINGVVFPELPVINFAQFSDRNKPFALVHVPPSASVPHVTTRDITETDGNGKKRVVLAKHTVYYRQGAKSEAASPLQHQKIAERRNTRLRDELLRRVREVPIPVLAPGRVSTAASGTTITVARLTNDSTAPVVRLSRATSPTAGVLLHEELSDGLFEEINNVLGANKLLAGATSRFMFGEEIYFRIYAERHHVQRGENRHLLLRTALRELYGPYLFWLTGVPASAAARELVDAISKPKHPLVLGACRAVVLLGRDATAWLDALLERTYGRLSQPPEFYWTVKRMVARTALNDRRLIAMGTTGAAAFHLPDDTVVSTSDLLASPEHAITHLSRACMQIFEGKASQRGVARQLDIAAYGAQVGAVGEVIWKEISHATEVISE